MSSAAAAGDGSVTVEAFAGAIIEADVFKKCTPKGKLPDMHIRLTRRESVIKAVQKVLAMPHIAQMMTNFRALDDKLTFKKRLVFGGMKRVGATMQLGKSELTLWARGEVTKLLPLIAAARQI